MSATAPTPRQREVLPERVVARLERRRSNAAGAHRARPRRTGRANDKRAAIREQLALTH